MDSQLLVKELERLRRGQDGAENRVLFLISRSSLLLLTENDTNAEDASASLVIKARLSTADERSTAYLFSSQETLNEWCTAKGFAPYGISIHGADMAFALPKGTWIHIDPDTTYGALLSPEQLNSLENATAPGGMEIIVAPAIDKGFVSPGQGDAAASAPTVYRPVEEDIKNTDGPSGPSKKRFFPRSHPTTLFSAPQIEKKEEPAQGRQRTYTSSNLKKVIRSMKPDGEGEGDT